MDNGKYRVVYISEITKAQFEQAVTIYIDGFYNIYSKLVSKDKELLKQLFSNSFNKDMVLVCLDGDKVVGFLGLGDINKRTVCLKKEICQQLFGKLKGAMLYKQMGAIMHEIAVREVNEGYIDQITTDINYRGKGVATRLIKYACDNLNYNRYYLDVLSKNTNAKRLYESLGFVEHHVKKDFCMMLGGFGSLIVMKLDLNKNPQAVM